MSPRPRPANGALNSGTRLTIGERARFIKKLANNPKYQVRVSVRLELSRDGNP